MSQKRYKSEEIIHKLRVAEVELGKPADFFYCECGHEWCDTYSWADRMADHAERG